MSDQTPPPMNPTIDPYKLLQIVLNPDGTITRLLQIPNSLASPDPTLLTSVLSKDIIINQSNNTWARVYLPKQALDSTSSSKLPLIVCFHGGGFILFSAASTIFHNFCSSIAVDLSVIIVSVDYRLAPEHRLPAAYDDALEALHWIKTSPHDWLKAFADFSQCYLMGGSAGGNIAYHVGLRVAEATVGDLQPLMIKGLILHQPFFGGSKRSESEIRLINDPVLPPCVTDLMWELSLPIGVDRDHEYCNAMVGHRSKILEKMKLMGWRFLVFGCDGDPLIDRQVEFVKMLQENGLQVVSHFTEGDYHGVEVAEPGKAEAMHVVYKNFMFGTA